MKNKIITSLAAFALLAATSVFADHAYTSSKFEGAKADKGTVAHVKEGSKNVLTLSDDFKVPGTPAPHWEVVDSKGNTYLLNRLVIKGDKYNKSITLPDYIHDVAKVQIWCAYAEVLLGEASFEKQIELVKN